MGKILFSYRSADNKTATRILERLTYKYGSDDVHTDISNPPQDNRRTYVEHFLNPYSIVVLVIGPSWVTNRNRSGSRRLDDPEDIVRLEIEVALSKGISILPLLVRGAKMPESGALPDGMKPLAHTEPLLFGSDTEFRGDMMRLHRLLVKKIVDHDKPKASSVPDDSPPPQARKDQLKEAASIRQASHKPPFQGVRIDTLGEVRWILGAQSGQLGLQYGDRRFPPDLSGADLSRVNLSGATLVGAKLEGAKLIQANLSGANLTGAILSGADLTEASLANARLDRSMLQSAKLQLTDLSACTLIGADLSDVNLTTTTLNKAVLNDVNLHKAILRELELPDAVLNNSDLSEADLRDATLTGAQLSGAKFEGTSLYGTTMANANLAGADLTGATLNLTDFSSANLSGASIGEIEALSNVILDADTRLDKVRWGGRPVKEPREYADRNSRLRAYREAAQTNHDLAGMLRERGFLAEASSYRLAEQKMRRGVLLTTGHYGAWLFSWILNVISGYGERVSRTAATYLIIVLGFALTYFVGTNYLHIEAGHLSVYQAIIQSIVSFHGRGFVSSALQLGDPMSGLTAVESVIGLFIEGIFIATFSRRFLGD